MQNPKMKKVIHEDKTSQIRLFWNEKSYKKLCIRDIKAGMWRIKNEVPPCNATISKTLKKDLGMSYKTLKILHTKTQNKDQVRTYWEGAIIQSIFVDLEWELIFIDEFNISSHRSKFREWALKDHKPAIVAALDKFSMYFVIAASSQHIYGIMASEKANTAEVFMYFLDNLLIHHERLFNKCSEKTLFIIDNASIHKTKSVDEYAKRKEIPLLTIPPYSLAINGAETIIQSIKSKVNLQKSNGR